MYKRQVLVAYSGGVDSTFLLKVAIDTLGRENVLAVTARSETYPSREFKEAKKYAQEMGARLKIIQTSELGIKGFKNNPVNRCYHCKKELFSKLIKIAHSEGMGPCLDGTNYDDRKDVRYGRLAAEELGVRSPLFEAQITKDEIRKLSRQMRLATWDKPSFACLASRFPHDTLITKKKLGVVDAAESFVRRLGVRQVRVRHYGELARIEVSPEDIGLVAKTANAARVVARFKRFGFKYVTVDLGGYRTGSMNK